MAVHMRAHVVAAQHTWSGPRAGFPSANVIEIFFHHPPCNQSRFRPFTHCRDGPGTGRLCPYNGATIMQKPNETAAPVLSNVADKPQPTNAKRNRKPRAAKPAPAETAPVAKPSEPSAAEINRERAIANRAYVAPLYSGASPVAHSSRPPLLADALARVVTPIQRAKRETERDASFLMLASKHCDASGTFSPVDATADLGAISRCASLGYFAVSGERIALTDSGNARVAALRKIEANAAALRKTA